MIEPEPDSPLSKLLASRTPVPATNAREAVAAFKAQTTNYYLSLAVDAIRCGNAINAGQDYPSRCAIPSLMGLGVRVSATEVVIVAPLMEDSTEVRKRIGLTEPPLPTAKEEMDQWAREVDFSLAKVYQNCQIKGYIVALSPNLKDEPLVAGRTFSEDELVTVLEGKAPYGYAWCRIPGYAK